MAKIKLKGLEKVLSNLNTEVKKIKNQTEAGMIRASIIIRRSMEDSPPKIPVDTGNLRASYFTVVSSGKTGKGKASKFKGKQAKKLASEHNLVREGLAAKVHGETSPTLILGFTASYAFYVHEMIGATFQRPGAGSKFLEKAIKRNKKEILRVIQQEAKIK